MNFQAQFLQRFADAAPARARFRDQIGVAEEGFSFPDLEGIEMSLVNVLPSLPQFAHDQHASVSKRDAPAFGEQVVDFHINNLRGRIHFVKLV